MSVDYTYLKNLPIAGRNTLLEYIYTHIPTLELGIVTHSGQVYYGTILQLDTNGREGHSIVINGLNKATNRASIIHLYLQDIETIELPNTPEAITSLALGKSKNQYSTSGKLEVERAFVQFKEALTSQFGIENSISKFELPTDGTLLNRVLVLLHIIQKNIVNLLADKDALESWKESFDAIDFKLSKSLEVTKSGRTLHIGFPYTDINYEEINTSGLREKLMSIL
jgi:hypothetical protein